MSGYDTAHYSLGAKKKETLARQSGSETSDKACL